MSLVDDAQPNAPSPALSGGSQTTPSRSFDAVYPTLYAAAYETVYRYESNRAHAADFAQEAMIRAYSRWRTLQHDPHCVAWVRRTAINLAISAWRKRQTAERFRHLTASRTADPDHQDPTDARVALQRSVSRLPKRQREAIALRFYADLPEIEVAAALGCSPSAVRTHLARAIDTLRADLVALPELGAPDGATAVPAVGGANAARTVAQARSVRRRVATTTTAFVLVALSGVGAVFGGVATINSNNTKDRQPSTTTTTTTTTTAPTTAPSAVRSGAAPAQPGPATLGNANAASRPAPGGGATPDTVEPSPPGAGPAAACASPADSACRPSANTTGVPAGTTLRIVGELTVSEPGARIDGLDIRGCVRVLAPDVTISRSRIRASCTTVLENLATNLTVENVEIDGVDTVRSRVCLGWSNYTARRVQAKNCSTTIRVGDDTTILDSYLTLGGCGAERTVVATTGARNALIRGNTIDAGCTDANAALVLEPRDGPMDRVVIDRNYFNGGGWTVYLGYGSGLTTPRSVTATNNAFGPMHAFGPLTGSGPTDVITGNTGL